MLAPSTVEGECARAPFTNLFQAVVHSEEVRRSHPETQQVKVLRSGRDAAQIHYGRRLWWQPELEAERTLP